MAKNLDSQLRAVENVAASASSTAHRPGDKTEAASFTAVTDAWMNGASKKDLATAWDNGKANAGKSNRKA